MLTFSTKKIKKTNAQRQKEYRQRLKCRIEAKISCLKIHKQETESLNSESQLRYRKSFLILYFLYACT